MAEIQHLKATLTQSEWHKLLEFTSKLINDKSIPLLSTFWYDSWQRNFSASQKIHMS